MIRHSLSGLLRGARRLHSGLARHVLHPSLGHLGGVSGGRTYGSGGVGEDGCRVLHHSLGGSRHILGSAQHIPGGHLELILVGVEGDVFSGTPLGDALLLRDHVVPLILKIVEIFFQLFVEGSVFSEIRDAHSGSSRDGS